jgi:hypothetical protein
MDNDNTYQAAFHNRLAQLGSFTMLPATRCR